MLARTFETLRPRLPLCHYTCARSSLSPACAARCGGKASATRPSRGAHQRPAASSRCRSICLSCCDGASASRACRAGAFDARRAVVAFPCLRALGLKTWRAGSPDGAIALSAVRRPHAEPCHGPALATCCPCCDSPCDSADARVDWHRHCDPARPEASNRCVRAASYARSASQSPSGVGTSRLWSLASRASARRR